MCVPLGRRRDAEAVSKVAAGSTTFPPPDRSGAVPPVGRLSVSPRAVVGSTTRLPPLAPLLLTVACSRAVNAGSCPTGHRLVTVARTAKKPHDAGDVWHACQRYRATANGKQHRRDQSRRYRDRAQQSMPLAEPLPPTPDSRASHSRGRCGAAPNFRHRRLPSPPTARASAQPKFPKQFLGRPCDRPGCYVLFRLSPRSPQSRILFLLVSSGFTASSTAGSTTQTAAAAVAAGLDIVAIGDHPNYVRSCRHILRMPRC